MTPAQKAFAFVAAYNARLRAASVAVVSAYSPFPFEKLVAEQALQWALEHPCSCCPLTATRHELAQRHGMPEGARSIAPLATNDQLENLAYKIRYRAAPLFRWWHEVE